MKWHAGLRGQQPRSLARPAQPRPQRRQHRRLHASPWRQRRRSMLGLASPAAAATHLPLPRRHRAHQFSASASAVGATRPPTFKSTTSTWTAGARDAGKPSPPHPSHHTPAPWALPLPPTISPTSHWSPCSRVQ